MDTLVLDPLPEDTRAEVAWGLGAQMPGLGPGWWDDYPAPDPSGDPAAAGAAVLAAAAATGGEVVVPR